MKSVKFRTRGTAMTNLTTTGILTLALVLSMGQLAAAEVSKEELKSISTPDKVNTSLGELKFFDGVPTDDTVKKVYDNLDRMRGVEVFLNTLGGASMYRIRAGHQKVGITKSNQVAIFSQFMDSKNLFLTGNTSTLYTFVLLDTEKDGPIVLDIPPGMLGFVNDAWFRYVEDMGIAGPDKGKGGKYLVLPPGYKGDVPKSGYFVLRPKTYWSWVTGARFDGKGPRGRPSRADGGRRSGSTRLTRRSSPPKTEFVDMSQTCPTTRSHPTISASSRT